MNEGREARLPLVTPDAAATTEQVGEQLARRTQKLLHRSLHLRHLDAGSCNACDWEITATTNAIYDVQRFGIDFVASPRHADAVLVTGPITRNLEIAVRRAYAAMPEPKLVIAVGICACSGAVYPGGYAAGAGVASVLPVDIYIPGCPPRPQAILQGLLLAMDRLEQRVSYQEEDGQLTSELGAGR
jgi:Ni,Fe-hydrogenase III small subunit